MKVRRKYGHAMPRLAYRIREDSSTDEIQHFLRQTGDDHAEVGSNGVVAWNDGIEWHSLDFNNYIGGVIVAHGGRGWWTVYTAAEFNEGWKEVS